MRLSPAQEVHQRAMGRCEGCWKASGSLNYAHRKRRSQGGEMAPWNGLSLCGSGRSGCHGWATAHPDMAKVLGWEVPEHLDPRAVSVWIRTEREWQDGQWVDLVQPDDGGPHVVADAEVPLARALLALWCRADLTRWLSAA